MGVASSARLLAEGVLWRRLGLSRAGAALVRALDGDEQERLVAGMGLVQAGERSVDVLESALHRRTATVTIVHVLADIGGVRARCVLDRIAGSAAGDAAALARQVLDEGRSS